MLKRISQWFSRLRSAPGVPTETIPRSLSLSDGTALPIWTHLASESRFHETLGARPAILVLFPYPLLPADNGGSSRTLVLLEMLRDAGYAVWLAAVGLREEHRKALKGRADVMVAIPNFEGDPETRIRESGLNTLKARYHPAFDEVVPALVRLASPRAVFSCFAFSAYCLERVPKDILRIVDTHDVQHKRADIARLHGGDLESRRCTREDEFDAMKDADVLVSIQPEEQKVFGAMFPDKEHVVCGHAVTRFQRMSPSDGALQVLFIGNRYDPNTRGMQAFLREAWPTIRDHIPTAVLDVVGTVSRDLPADVPGVTLHGFVPDVTPFYESAAVVINPVAYGSGQKIKTIEALALGKCLVTTEAGLQGIPSGVPCVVAAEMTEMAAAVANLLAEPAKRKAMEKDALEFARANFSPPAVFRDLLSTLSEEGSAAWRR